MNSKQKQRAKPRRKSRSRRGPLAPSMRNIRSAITNGSQLLANCDHRSAWMRRLRDLIQGHLADGGGVEQLSMAEQSIIRRASMCELQMEMMETRFAENGGVASADELNLYQRTASSTR